MEVPRKFSILELELGFSVREVIEHAGIVTNRHVTVLESDRREGDCTKLVSGPELARTELGWEPKRSTLKHMITDAWRWHQKTWLPTVVTSFPNIMMRKPQVSRDGTRV